MTIGGGSLPVRRLVHVCVPPCETTKVKSTRLKWIRRSKTMILVEITTRVHLRPWNRPCSASGRKQCYRLISFGWLGGVEKTKCQLGIVAMSTVMVRNTTNKLHFHPCKVESATHPTYLRLKAIRMLSALPKQFWIARLGFAACIHQ